MTFTACDEGFFAIKSGNTPAAPSEENLPNDDDSGAADAQVPLDPAQRQPTSPPSKSTPPEPAQRQPTPPPSKSTPPDSAKRPSTADKPNAAPLDPPPTAAPGQSIDNTTPQTDVRPHLNAPNSFADLVEQVQPAVVNVYTEQVIPQREVRVDPIYGPYAVTRPHRATSLGSGFIFDKEGYILTNTHVIDGAHTVKISTVDGTEIPAAIIGTDPATDIALLKIRPFEGMKVLPLGDSDKTRVGDWLMAVGNPFGLQSTVTTGILSARGRQNVPIGGQVRYIDFLQTDASINPGNSGGPLIAMDGTVVGINTAINAQGQGIGFAIPINMTQFVLDDLRNGRAVSRAWLGVQIADPPRDHKGNKQRGALIAAIVRDGPAARAGIRPGDIVTQLGENEVQGPQDLSWLASTAGVNTDVPVVVRRSQEEVHLTVRMGPMPN